MINLPGNTYLHTMDDSINVTLSPELDGARLTVSMNVFAQYSADSKEQRTVDISATLLAGRTSNPNEMATVTTLRSESLYTTMEQPNRVKLSAHISAAALREFEELRDGEDIWLVLTHIHGVTMDLPPALRLHETPQAVNIAFRLRARGEWSEQVQAVTSASFIDIMIPVTDDPALATAAARVAKARNLLRAGQFSACAGELRQALDPVRDFYDTQEENRKALAKGSTQRTEPERFAMAVQSTYAWLSSYIHDDSEAIKGLDMGRAEAVMALGTVAGMLHRTARDMRATGAV